MKIVFFGDSITDACRNFNEDLTPTAYGTGYVMQVAGELLFKDPKNYVIYNRGISGNRIVDLYARMKSDVINLQPDVLSILIGVNDVWHELEFKNGVELPRFERIYDMMLDDLKEKLPNTKIIICQPFVLKGVATEKYYDKFLQVKDYANVAKSLAQKHGCYFLPLQEKFDKATENCPVEFYLQDGVHPNIAGAKLIANEWLKLFEQVK